MGVKDRLIALEDSARAHSTLILRDGAELYVENCRCVSACDDNFITLSVSGMNVKVCGAPLMLESFGAYGVKITGKIHSLTLEDI